MAHQALSIDEDDFMDPEAGPDPGYDTILPEEELTYLDSAAGTAYMVGGVVLSAVEIATLIILWRRAGTKSWPWYALAGLVGLRAVGAITSMFPQLNTVTDTAVGD